MKYKIKSSMNKQAIKHMEMGKHDWVLFSGTEIGNCVQIPELFRNVIKKYGLLVKSLATSKCWTIGKFDNYSISYCTGELESYEEFAKENVWFDDNSPCGVVEEEI